MPRILTFKDGVLVSDITIPDPPPEPEETSDT